MRFINRKILLTGGIATAVLLVIGGFYAKGAFSNKDKGEVLAAQTSDAISITVETAGGDRAQEMDDLGISWPGEIISLGDVEVQPQREGTIVEWKVNIGQKVYKGQTLGRLSAPPAAPEFVGMLAEKAESLAKAKNQATAFTTFAEKNKKQLLALREALEKNSTSPGADMESNRYSDKSKSVAAARIALDQARAVVEVKRKKARVSIEQGIVKTFSKVTNSSSDPFAIYKNTNGYFPLYFKNTVGIASSQSREKYANALPKLLSDLRNPNTLPEDSAQAYFQAALGVASASFVGEDMTADDIADLREAVTESQSEAIEALQEYEEAKLEVANMESELAEKEIEYAEKNKDITEKISELEKEVELAQGDAKAEAAAYGTVAGTLTGGLNIISPQTGIVSVIYKKNGEFVSLGMPLAAINAADNKERFVRFYIPSNLTMPEPGTELTIMRPGFANDAKKVKLIGTGTSLSGNGSYAADAKFIDQIDWPVRASVRVMPPQGFVSNISVALTAVWWNDNAEANVWLVTEENRIRPQQIKIGRTLGDRLEVIEGLQIGSRYVSKALPGLAAGQMLTDVKIEQGQQPDANNTGEQSAHSHDE